MYETWIWKRKFVWKHVCFFSLARDCSDLGLWPSKLVPRCPTMHMVMFALVSYGRSSSRKVLLSIKGRPRAYATRLAKKRALTQNSDPHQTCRYNCILAYIGYLTVTLILILINQHSEVYLRFTNIAFWDPNSAQIWPRFESAASAAAACFCAVHMEWAMHSLFMPTFRHQKSARKRYLYNINVR